MEKEIKAVAYARVSSKEQAEKEFPSPPSSKQFETITSKKAGNWYMNG
jgi:DNA invertase Pin-like site-specific DNA recombinase